MIQAKVSVISRRSQCHIAAIASAVEGDAFGIGIALATAQAAASVKSSAGRPSPVGDVDDVFSKAGGATMIDVSTL
jgi:hypothetical protein